MPQPEFIPTQADAYRLLHNGILAFSQAEEAGMRVDVEYCQHKINYLERKAQRLEKKLEESKFIKHWKHVYGKKFNANNDWQLRDMLYNRKKITPPHYTSSGNGAVDEVALSQIDLPELQRIVEIRKYRKVKDTYLDSFLREQVKGYVHPILNLHITQTYRPSTNNPNLANIPKREEWMKKTCRQALYPRPGHQLLEVDFGNLEVMIAYCYHKDPNMYQYLTEPGTNMHSDMAHQIFCLSPHDKIMNEAGGIKKVPELNYLRDATKNGFTFPQFYGDYYGKNASSLCRWVGLPQGKWKRGQGVKMPDGHNISDHLTQQGIKSFDQFVEHMKRIEEDFWGRRFKVYQQWKDEWVKKYKHNGYFDMYTGFRCKGVMKKNEVINYPIQGSAFHCLLWCFIEIDRIAKEEGWKTRLVNQIYDSMVLDVHPNELEHVAWTVNKVTCVSLPDAWPWIIIPLEIEADLCGIDQPWSAKKSFELPKVT